MKSEYSRLFLYLAIQEESSVTVPVPCTGRFSTSFGLPCKHRLKEYLNTDEPIPLASIHRQWLLDAPEDDESEVPPPLSPRGMLMKSITDRLYDNPDSKFNIGAYSLMMIDLKSLLFSSERKTSWSYK